MSKKAKKRVRKKSTIKKQREKRILESALQVFLKHGFHGATMELIALTAHASKRSLYEQYEGKEDMFRQLLRETINSVAKPAGRLAHSHKPAREILYDFALECSKLLLAPEVLALWRLAAGETQRFPEIGELFYDSSHYIGKGVVRELLQELDSRDELRLEHPDIGADHFWSLVFERIHTFQVFHVTNPMQKDEIRERLQIGVDAFLRLYHPRPH